MPKIKDHSKEINLIRNMAKSGSLKFSKHARERCAERGIKILDVVEAIKNGAFVEYQDIERDPKLMFQDSIGDPPRFFAVVTIKHNNCCLVVTTYLPDADKWELVSGNWRRKNVKRI